MGLIAIVSLFAQERLPGTTDFKSVAIAKNIVYVYTSAPGKREVEFTWTDMDPKPGTLYYYVRGQQEDGGRG